MNANSLPSELVFMVINKSIIIKYKRTKTYNTFIILLLHECRHVIRTSGVKEEGSKSMFCTRVPFCDSGSTTTWRDRRAFVPVEI